MIVRYVPERMRRICWCGREDISAVSQLMDQKVYRQFRKKYEGWDRQENLEFDARVAGRAQNPVYICR